jgi:hypothetical protein
MPELGDMNPTLSSLPAVDCWLLVQPASGITVMRTARNTTMLISALFFI